MKTPFTNKSKAKHPLNDFILQKLDKRRRMAILGGRQHQAYSYNRVIKALTKYPLPIICQQQVNALDGVGSKLSVLITNLINQQYSDFLMQNSNKIEQESYQKSSDNQLEQQYMSMHSQIFDKVKSVCSINSKFSLRQKQYKSERNYEPSHESTGWYLLHAIYLCCSLKQQQFANKKQIKEYLKQNLKINIENWSCLKTLIKHDYVLKQDQRYKLTDKGKNYFNQKIVPQSKQNIYTTIQMHPHNGKVILVIDNRQIKNQNERNFIYQTLQNTYKIPVQIDNLILGDFLWIEQYNQIKYVLPFIMQRKKISDLASSIIDGRYKQQKIRLINSSIPNPFYLIEGNNLSDSLLPSTTIQNSIYSTTIQGFNVIRSADLNQSIKIVAQLTFEISNQYENNNCKAICNYEEFQKMNGKETIGLIEKMIMSVKGISRQASYKLGTKIQSMEQLYQMIVEAGDQSKKLLKELMQCRRGPSERTLDLFLQLFSK